MNYILPLEEKQLSMHCSANMGDKGDTAIFFGLSGTGKTTLSADPKRVLIGDDEHGWSNNGIYNFEGGCYAKAINLDPEKEPQIWNAIKFGAIVENTIFHPGTSIINYKDNSLTENTRTAYPISHIPNSIDPPLGTLPQTVFFLTADAFGVLPPISKLNPSQAMYHFISGYTAKVAGTEMGIKEPQVTFSACFGEAFLPLNPTVYAALLGKLMKQHQVDVWLINTGWTGGSYGTGKRIPLAYTRAMVNAALEGKMNNVSFEKHPIFKIQIPSYCPGVPSELLNPKNTWENPGNYDQTAAQLARAFQENFAKYTEEAPPEIMDGGPSLDF
ncbi:hypothetical protein GCM10007049_03530 [Echinicola pacifica]|uniref:Phosphoenolpyruvate carboxykinase (ATP) n=1 Tax=Echinicola pacifica TaxID=346377 RepID=A0A918UJF9_9BACT|nr:phosphoenolpyruvate carboxykinase (ATP) [Echinicola pacifica]GGZ14840.1 hypothetical protein GCM10007049_03530 [Echinicola pacifica]